MLLINTYKMSCHTSVFDRLKIYPTFLDFTPFTPYSPLEGVNMDFSILFFGEDFSTH